MQETAILEQPESNQIFKAFAKTFFSYKGLLALTPILFFLACSNLSDYDSEQIKSSLNDSLVVTTESWDVEMMLTQAGKKRIYIEGTYAINYQQPDNKHTKISGPVYVQIYDTLGAVESEAWSKRAVYLEEDAEFELYDSVRVQTSEDRFLYSEYLKWSQNTDQITSPYFVTIITPTDSISGRGFEGLTDLSSYTIIEPRGRWLVD